MRKLKNQINPAESPPSVWRINPACPVKRGACLSGVEVIYCLVNRGPKRIHNSKLKIQNS
jgi:hypothetical protein